VQTRAVRVPSMAAGAGLLRSLIEEIRPVPEGGRLEIEVMGDLAGILALGPSDKRPTGSADRAQQTLVAGTRNHRELILQYRI
jgi:site-specific DNA recombinase